MRTHLDMKKEIKKKEEIGTNTSVGWPNSHPTECVCRECNMARKKKMIECECPCHKGFFVHPHKIDSSKKEHCYCDSKKAKSGTIKKDRSTYGTTTWLIRKLFQVLFSIPLLIGMLLWITVLCFFQWVWE